MCRRRLYGASDELRPQILDGERASKEISLDMFASEFHEGVELGDFLDSLRSRPESQRVREVDDGANDLGAPGTVGELGDERAVDLETVDGES